MPDRCSDFGVGSQLRAHSAKHHPAAKSNWAQTPISRASTLHAISTIAFSAYATCAWGQFPLNFPTVHVIASASAGAASRPETIMAMAREMGVRAQFPVRLADLLRHWWFGNWDPTPISLHRRHRLTPTGQAIPDTGHRFFARTAPPPPLIACRHSGRFK